MPTFRSKESKLMAQLAYNINGKNLKYINCTSTFYNNLLFKVTQQMNVLLATERSMQQNV